jgi:hypothetical protein
MKSQDYWQKRSEAIAEGQYKKADDYLNGLADAYGRAKGNIQKEIEVFYSRYAENNEISYATRMVDGRKS